MEWMKLVFFLSIIIHNSAVIIFFFVFRCQIQVTLCSAVIYRRRHTYCTKTSISHTVWCEKDAIACYNLDSVAYIKLFQSNWNYAIFWSSCRRAAEHVMLRCWFCGSQCLDVLSCLQTIRSHLPNDTASHPRGFMSYLKLIRWLFSMSCDTHAHLVLSSVCDSIVLAEWCA